MTTLEDVRNARRQANGGGHPVIKCDIYKAHIDCLFDVIADQKIEIEGLDHELEDSKMARKAGRREQSGNARRERLAVPDIV